MSDTYLTVKDYSEGEFKDRGSKFLAYCWPVQTEQDIQQHLDFLRKEHFKARHHCYAWRMGRDGNQFRANDDGEPSGTAGRPILGQIDSFKVTDVLIVVVRYFGGTLLGTSGLINAYREAAAEALKAARIEEVILHDTLRIDMDYSLMPDTVQAIHQTGIAIRQEQFDDRAHINIAIRQRDTAAKLLQLKARIWKCSTEEAETLEWPGGMRVDFI